MTRLGYIAQVSSVCNSFKWLKDLTLPILDASPPKWRPKRQFARETHFRPTTSAEVALGCGGLKRLVKRTQKINKFANMVRCILAMSDLSERSSSKSAANVPEWSTRRSFLLWRPLHGPSLKHYALWIPDHSPTLFVIPPRNQAAPACGLWGSPANRYQARRGCVTSPTKTSNKNVELVF